MEIKPFFSQLQGISNQVGIRNLNDLKDLGGQGTPFTGIREAVDGLQDGIERVGNKDIDINGIGDNGAFARFLKSAVNEVDQAQKTAQQNVQDVVTGKSDNIHEAMISMEQAQLSFQLMLEIRNKMMETYQELSRMQM